MKADLNCVFADHIRKSPKLIIYGRFFLTIIKSQGILDIIDGPPNLVKFQTDQIWRCAFFGPSINLY